MSNSNNRILSSTKDHKGNNPKIRGLIPDGKMTFHTSTGFEIVIFVMECAPPFTTTQFKKDQDKRKLDIESCFVRTEIIQQFKLHYEDLINSEVAQQMLEVETFYIQTYGI